MDMKFMYDIMLESIVSGLVHGETVKEAIGHHNEINPNEQFEDVLKANNKTYEEFLEELRYDAGWAGVDEDEIIEGGN